MAWMRVKGLYPESFVDNGCPVFPTHSFFLSDHPSDSHMAECGARMNEGWVDVGKDISHLSQ